MSRFRRALHGVASSYILLAATAVYSLASVPVALHYLALPPDHDPKRFGLWIIMGTLAGYMNLIDAGMTSSSSRLLVDHKDDRNGGNYGSLLKTGWLVFILQGAIVFVIGLSLAGTFARLLAIDEALRPEFIQLVKWQCGVVALTFAARMFYLMLNANQRMDLTNYIGTCSLVVNFAAQWIFFHYHFGVLSLALGALCSAIVAVILQMLACSSLKLFPTAGHWGRVSWSHFLEIFDFGKDVFLLAIGAQLITTSQIIVITRILGPAEAAVWGIGLRVFNLLNQVIWRIADMSWSGFAEMLARGERDRLRDRYRSLAILTFSFAAWAAVSFASSNSLFVSVWTSGNIHWPAGNDWLLALWMIILSVTHCHTGLIITTKQIGAMRYMYLVEGAIFTGACFLVARWGGLAAIIGCSILCASIFTGAYGVWRVSRYLGLSTREVALDWLLPMFKVLLYYLPVTGLAYWVLASASGVTQLVIHTLLAGSLGFYLLLRFGVPGPFQDELLRRAPAKLLPFLKRAFHRIES